MESPATTYPHHHHPYVAAAKAAATDFEAITNHPDAAARVTDRHIRLLNNVLSLASGYVNLTTMKR